MALLRWFAYRSQLRHEHPGKAWSYKSVLRLLRNRTYLGQVHFRGTWSDSRHPPLVEAGLFDAAHAILTERGEDVSKRATNSSEYLLTGLVVCGACGSHFSGTAATGRSATYRYYTCGGRQRYGRKTRSADRLPAEALDDAVLRSLLAAYDHVELFVAAVEEAQRRAALGQDRHQGELHAIEAELAKVDAGIERYLRAFETGAMPETLCGERVKALGAQATALRARREQLADVMEDADLIAPTPEELSALRERVAEAVAKGSPGQVKALFQALIHVIRVDNRDAIHSSFRVPLGGDHHQDNAVRAPSRSVRSSRLGLTWSFST
ncbi:MAG: recombinase zinc beta ribbon domain-containing protein [Actinomycetota bacterium]|nr:recombinase zinc beta ribbon domain-containing protein [Actinomycetota bacterium]